ncbi:MAG: C26 family cysteine hydrolase domain-containing family [Candidatus Marinimicrobia bacterium]|nr:C26 family cysteine hydrolase domain-containing family [Candidatus Neomarinimicrobiota bacterium]
MLIKIGITQRVDKVESYDEWRDTLDQRLIDWVSKLGFVPIPIPNTLIDIVPPNSSQLTLENWLNTVKIDAILLSGGNDIGDIKQRDLTEKYLLSWAEDNKKPVLGICRGMQMMGVWSGGQLIEVEGHVGMRHNLQLDGTQSEVWPDSVNSYHNKVLKECPSLFNILAKSEDGNIEAMEHKVLPWEAWMWHPEREKQFSIIDQERFKRLITNEK